MAKTCLMIGKQTSTNGLVYRVTAFSSTLAEVVTETPAGVVLERREFTGSRAQAQALIAWTKATGLVGGGR